MDRRYRIKVWRDRLASAYPVKWSWEVLDRTAGGKVVGCGTTFSEAKSREAAARVVDMRQALLEERRAALGEHAWQASGPLVLRAARTGADV